MRPETTPTGYSRVQIALHWIVFALIARQYLLKVEVCEAWDRVAQGLEVGFDRYVPAHVVGVTLAPMRRAQG